MKYLAIIKDSFREAVDTKIFYVMVAITGLLTVMMALISFRPAPVADFGEYLCGPLNGDPLEMLGPGRGRRSPRLEGMYSLVSGVALDNPANAPGCPLRFTVKAHYINAAEAK